MSTQATTKAAVVATAFGRVTSARSSRWPSTVRTEKTTRRKSDGKNSLPWPTRWPGRFATPGVSQGGPAGGDTEPQGRLQAVCGAVHDGAPEPVWRYELRRNGQEVAPV